MEQFLDMIFLNGNINVKLHIILTRGCKYLKDYLTIELKTYKYNLK